MDAAYYEFVVRGRPGSAVTHWFPEFEVRFLEPDSAQLTGWVTDQAALHGLINNIGDLGLELLSVRARPSTDG